MQQTKTNPSDQTKLSLLEAAKLQYGVTFVSVTVEQATEFPPQYWEDREIDAEPWDGLS